MMINVVASIRGLVHHHITEVTLQLAGLKLICVCFSFCSSLRNNTPPAECVTYKCSLLGGIENSRTCVCPCVCVVQTYECANVHIFARTCGDQNRTWGVASPSNFLHPIALRQGLSLSWEIIASARLAGQEALKIYLSLPPTTNAGVIGMCNHVT